MRKFRNNEIKDEKLDQAVACFEEQLNNFYIEPLRQAVVNEAEQLLRKYGKTHGLRSLDALQLGTFNLMAEKSWGFVSADERLCEVAEVMNYYVINPIK